jgi:hypothetical protein
LGRDLYLLYSGASSAGSCRFYFCRCSRGPPEKYGEQLAQAARDLAGAVHAARFASRAAT